MFFFLDIYSPFSNFLVDLLDSIIGQFLLFLNKRNNVENARPKKKNKEKCPPPEKSISRALLSATFSTFLNYNKEGFWEIFENFSIFLP